MISRKRAVMLCVACAVLAASLGAGASLYYVYRSPLGKIYSIVNLLDKEFYRPVDWAEAMEGGARGAVAALGDPYSAYMSKNEWTEFEVRTSGEYSGIGVTIGVRDKQVIIAPPMKGSPAEEAGLRADDVITMVDGTPIYTSDKAASLIRGRAGTPVTLSILRGKEAFEVTIVRREIMIPATSYSEIEEGVGYIQLMSFNEHSSSETAAALQELKNQGAKVIILDLRNNGGGYVEECLRIAELLIPKGSVVTLKYKSQSPASYGTNGNGLGVPLLVLVNKGSASASEILAGAIQARKAGTLIGQTTFGKGVVQGAFFMRDGSVVKLTTAEYLTPSGQAINGAGLEPDVAVQGDQEQLAKALEMARAAIAATK